MAVPHPEDELARLQKLVGKGLPPVLLLTGVSDWFRGEAARIAIAALPADAEVKILDAVDERAAGGAAAEDEDAEDAADDGSADASVESCPQLQELRGSGLFARRTFLVVRRAANWWKNHHAAVALHAPKFAAGSGLVIEATKLDRRKKAAAAFVKSVADAGAFFELRDLWPEPFDRSRGPLDGELCRWVVKSAQKTGVPLDAQAAWLVVQQVGKSPAELLAELGRLRDRFPASRRTKPLTVADLRGVLTTSFESSPFELAEAVLEGDRRKAQRSVHAMFDRGVRKKDGSAGDASGVLPFATHWLHQQIAGVHEGRVLLDSGVSPPDLPGRCGVRQFPERFVANVKRNDARRLLHGLRALHHCQRMSRLTGEDPQALLERFLVMWFDGAPIPSLAEMDL